MQRAELLRLFGKPDTPTASKSTNQSGPSGIIVRNKLSMAAFYRRKIVMSSKNWKIIKFIFNKSESRLKRCLFEVFAIERPCGILKYQKKLMKIVEI